MQREGHRRDLLLEADGLLRRPRAAGEHEAVGVAVFLDGLSQQLQDDGIGHRLLLLHVAVDLRAQPRLGGHLLLDHGDRVQVDHVELLAQPAAMLRALAQHENNEGRRAEVHRSAVFALLGHIDVDDLLRLWRAVLLDAVRRLESLLRWRLVRVVLNEPLAEPIHRCQTLRPHLAEGEEAARNHLLQRGVEGVVRGVHGR
mmetsp:Transcript_92806/g.266892  ORF Transcript_92806/g.266892 Transcript_92806/m.266892 type:complete len:200 (-) Transcript_92806:1370-1969(-)